MKTKKLLFISLFLIIGLLFIPNTVNAAIGDEIVDEGVKYIVLTENGNSGTVKVADYNGNQAKVIIPETIIHNSNSYTVTEIGYNAFGGNRLVTNLVLPDTLTWITDSAFSGCSALTSIIIPDSVTGIGYNAFGGCTSLANIVLPDSLTTITQSSFNGCSAITSLLIPDSVTSIEYNAFGGCSSLTSVVIPNSVSWIGYNAFGGCYSLTAIYGYANSYTQQYASDNYINFVEINEKPYKVITDLTNVTSNGLAFIESNLGSYTATLSPSFECILPNSITVTMGGTTLTAGLDYSYNNKGEITITKAILGDIKIIAEGIMVQKSVNTTLTNIESDGQNYVYPAAGNYIATLTASEGYKLPETIKVKVDGAEITDFTYDSNTGKLVIRNTAITGEVEIIAEAIKVYIVTVNQVEGAIITPNGAMVQPEGSLLDIKIIADAGYKLIAVKVNGELQALPLHNNAITLDNINKDIDIEVEVEKNIYEIYHNITNLKSSNLSKTIESFTEYSTIFIANEGYELPDSITVKVGNTILNTTQYTYNSRTGELVIPATNILGDITIEAIGVETIYKVIFDANGGTFKNEKGTLTIDKWEIGDEENLEKPTREGYEFLGYYTEKIGGTSLEKYIAEAGIDNNLTFYAQWKEVEIDNIENLPSDDIDNTTDGNNPQTGDNILLFVGLLAISVVGIIITSKFRK